MSDSSYNELPEETVALQEEVMRSFREFEASFRRKYPAMWLTTLLLPPVLTTLILVALAIMHGIGYVQTLVVAAFVTFFGLGRFAIPLVDQLDWLNLSKEAVFAMVTYMDLMVALIIPFQIGLMFRLPVLGPKISALVADGQFILSSNKWMKKASFLGLIAFVTFPLAATGSVGGAIFARLLGMSRLASIVGIAIGSLLGNGVMYLFADLFAQHMDQNNPIIKWGGVLAIVVIVIVLERRYRFAKKKFLNAQPGGPKAPAKDE